MRNLNKGEWKIMAKMMKRERILDVDAEIAETFRERTKGLLGRDGLAPGTGLLIRKCNCVHTLFMRFAIDATFLDRDGNVVKVVRNIRPWRPWIWGGWRAVSVLETAATEDAV